MNVIKIKIGFNQLNCERIIIIGNINMENQEVIMEEDTKGIDTIDGHITNPFSTKDIKITNVVLALPSLVSMLEHDEIDLNPDFQRHGDLWTQTNMSKLIESILLKLPLPIFYFDVSSPDKWIVVDGLQRLSTINQFMVKKTLKLKNLEFLDLNGKKYDDLDRSLKRIFEGTQIVTYQIEAQTPKEVRYSIFNRINTGGVPLNSQEIRQALNQKGSGVKFLITCAESEIFKSVVNVPAKRMLDRELVLRFMSFILTSNATEKFPFNNMMEFLDRAMEELDSLEGQELEKLKNDLLCTLEFTEIILGKGHRFSRSIEKSNKTNTLNRSLFDVLTVCFSKITEKEKFKKNKEIFEKKLCNLLLDEKSDFSRSITEGTSGKSAIETRFKIMNKLIEDVLNED